MSDAPFLLADIGGTSSRLAFSDGATLRPGTIRSYDNDRFADFPTLLRDFLTHHPIKPSAIALAAAGPHMGDHITLTNRNWTVSAAQVAAVTGCPDITLMNDLQAMGHALAVPAIAGGPLADTRLVLAIGTGLNAVVAHPTASGAYVPASETGYATLPFTTPDDAALLSALPVPAIESVLSGPGLSRLHHLLTGDTLPPQDITRTGSNTLDIALRLLGAHLGSLAVIHLPLGGVFLAGAVGRALFAHLDDPEFRHHYAARGPYSDLLASIPLGVIENDTAPLHGAAQALSAMQ